MAGVTCVVTVHGIGFQQPPNENPNDPGGRRPGYADQLHRLLQASGLVPGLGDDPERLEHGVHGPVYVQSPWNEPENGLSRLDPHRPLVTEQGDAPTDRRVAHVALIYSGLEVGGPRLGSALDTLARTALSLDAYAHPLGAAHLLAADIAAMLRRPAVPAGAPPSGLQPRRDLDPGPAGAAPRHRLHLMNLLHRAAPPAPGGATALTPASRLNLFDTLEHDVASYVCRNDLRERVRGFVQTALTRLVARDDVDTIVVNSHSQGTVLAVDVLGRYAPTKVTALVTAGSPLRKYVDLFAWGNRVGRLQDIVTDEFWLNIYDPLDPVADPLEPSGEWRADDALPDPSPHTLMQMPHPDQSVLRGTVNCPVTDLHVNNVAHSGGGLAAHNYWDNSAEFIPALAGVITRAAPSTEPDSLPAHAPVETSR
jgi:hypothetical protein